MNEFDLKAAGWEQNPMHRERSLAIVQAMIQDIPLTHSMSALEFGAGTGIASFLLKDYVKSILMMDSSSEMVKVMQEKITSSQVKNLQTIRFDLEKSDYTGGTFDLIFTHLVLHHIANTEAIFRSFHRLLNPGGYLAIADLYPEDGAFHGSGFNGHHGFETRMLSDKLKQLGMTNISDRLCYTIDKQVSETKTQSFGVFLLIANR